MMQNDVPKWRTILYHRHALWFIMGLSLILALPSLWISYYNTDELTNAIYAKFILDGKLTLSYFLGNTYLFTHYFYALVGGFFGLDTLMPIHFAYALWKCGTIAALYWTGQVLQDRQVGLWSALFYCLGSMAFLSKDFHSPNAEGLSLLPAILATGCFFCALKKQSKRYFFCTGLLVAAATFFKAPMGITIVVMGFVLLLSLRQNLVNGLVLGGGFFIFLFLPNCLVSPFGAGFRLMFENVAYVNAVYTQTYEGLSFVYKLVKFILRTTLVLGCLCSLTLFASQTIPSLFHLRKKHRDFWIKIFFLLSWFVALLFTTTLGGRMFYHYYVFLLAPLALLAGLGFVNFGARLTQTEWLQQNDVHDQILRFVYRHVLWFLCVPTLVFSFEAIFLLRQHQPHVNRVLNYVREHTHSDDTIYVWGYVPQIYFFTERQPATVYYWTELLTQTSNGTAAMEYIRASGQTLTLTEQLQKDFQTNIFQKLHPEKIEKKDSLSQIGENELFTLSEIHARIEDPYWQKVFSDFFTKPPEYFIDTSPTNMHGFGYRPITKYELMKRFVLDNYELATILDDMILYKRIQH